MGKGSVRHWIVQHEQEHFPVIVCQDERRQSKNRSHLKKKSLRRKQRQHPVS